MKLMKGLRRFQPRQWLLKSIGTRISPRKSSGNNLSIPEMDSDNVGWQNLPKDLLEMIAERTSIRLLRAVCSSWRSSLFLPTNKSPLFSVKIPLPLFLQNARDKNNGGYFNLTERIIYCVQPPSDQNNLNDCSKSRKGWMLKLEETLSGKMKLFHPLPKEELLNWENTLPPVLNLLDYRVFEVGKEYKLTWAHPQNNLRHKPKGLDSKVLKVVMSPSDNAIMCIFGGRKLGYFKYGDQNWYMIDDCLSKMWDYCDYYDVIHHKEKFYVIDTFLNITVVDSSLNFEVIDCFTDLDSDVDYSQSTLVESNGDLFVVIKHSTWFKYSPSCYVGDYSGGGENLGCHDVCKFSTYKAEMVEVTDLCNQTFFVDYGSCISVPSTQLSVSFPIIQFYRSCYSGDNPFSDVGILLPKEKNPQSIFCHDNRSLIFSPIPAWLKPAEL